MDALREFLIKLDNYYTEYIVQKENWDKVFVFTDETYIQKTHAAKYSFLGDKSEFNRSASRGDRLIILHAISPDGPLCERVNDIPVCDLKWTKDTPNSEDREDGLLSCELIWKASSKSGDYTTTT